MKFKIKRITANRLLPGSMLLLWPDTGVQSINGTGHWLVRDYFDRSNPENTQELRDMTCLVVSSGDGKRPVVLISYSGLSHLFYVVDTFVSLISWSPARDERDHP